MSEVPFLLVREDGTPEHQPSSLDSSEVSPKIASSAKSKNSVSLSGSISSCESSNQRQLHLDGWDQLRAAQLDGSGHREPFDAPPATA
jgi:hypothetical protein